MLADTCKALSAPTAGKSGTKRLAAAIARVAKVPRRAGASTPAAEAARTPSELPHGDALTMELSAEPCVALKPFNAAAAEREVRAPFARHRVRCNGDVR